MHWDRVPGDNDDEVAARGILYLLIFQQLGQLVRWSWGYNVLLAPADKVEGTVENVNSRVENGLGGSEEECEPLMRRSSVDFEGSDQDNSGSDDTRVNSKIFGKASADGLQLGHNCPSGERTPITHRRHASSISTGSSSGGVAGGQSPIETLTTPLNGNMKVPQQTPSLPIMQAEPNAVDEDVPSGMRGLLTRFVDTTRKGMEVGCGMIQAAIKLIAKAAHATTNLLPLPVQSIVSSLGLATGRFFLGVWSFMNPPLWAMLAAIIVASIPDLQRLLFTDGTFVKNSVTSAIKQSGGVAVPLILVVLGGNLARNTLPVEPTHTKKDDKEETKLVIASLISRMLLPLIIMAPMLAVTAKYVPISILDDPIFVIVCFLITGAPSALQLAQICQINNVYMGAMSRLLFQSYVIWILPSTLVLVMCALEVVEWAQR